MASNYSRLMVRLVILLACYGLTACSGFSPQNKTNKQVDNYQQFLHDELFLSSGPVPVVEQIQLLELPRSTKDYLDRYVVGLETEQERYQALRQWVFDRFSTYEYDAFETLSITNLVNVRKINCLSFSNLFVAAARYVDLPAQFQLVDAPPYWDSDNDTWIINQHINVFGDIKITTNKSISKDFELGFDRLLGHSWIYSVKPVDKRYRRKQRYVADLNRAIVSIPFKTKLLDDNQVLALFYNNKAGEAIQNKNLALAYSSIKASLEVDSSLAQVWNNLGVLYQRLGEYEIAEKVYRTAINLDDKSHSSQSNLANVLRALGREKEALAMEQVVEEYRQANPYYHFSLGEDRLTNEEPNRAAEHFSKAIQLKHNEQLFYFALAKAQTKLRQYDLVAENLKNARIYANGAEKSRYTNKLKQFEEAITALNTH